jgi:hypothetical protein
VKFSISQSKDFANQETGGKKTEQSKIQAVFSETLIKQEIQDQGQNTDQASEHQEIEDFFGLDQEC